MMSDIFSDMYDVCIIIICAYTHTYVVFPIFIENNGTCVTT